MNRRRMSDLLAMTLLALCLAPNASATTYREMSLEEILGAAETAFFATVAASRNEMRDGQPWTVVEFEIERLLGDAEEEVERTLELAFLGGRDSGGRILRVNLMPEFEVGEQVLVLAYQEEYYSPLVGFNQGLWRLRDGRLVDERGRALGVNDEGGLLAAGDPLGLERLLDTVDSALEESR